jgi:hypothetical protein
MRLHQRVIFVLAFFGISIALPGASALVRPYSNDEAAELTVLVYAAHDNNLDGFLKGDLQEMLQSSQPKVNFVVFVDRTATLRSDYEGNEALYDDALNYPYIGRFSDAKVFLVNNSRISDIQSLGEVYSHSPQTLAWFVGYGLTKYPAKRSILVMKNHGGGPLTLFGDATEYDTAPQDPDLHPPFFLGSWKAAVKAGLKAAFQAGWRGVGSKARLDAVIWDTCLNGSLEVARATAEVARFMMADEEITFGSTDLGSWSLDWRAAKLDVTVERSSSILGFLQSSTESLRAIYEGSSPDQYSIDDYALSIQDLDRIHTIDLALRQLTRTLDEANGYSTLRGARVSDVLEFGRLTFKTGADYTDKRYLFPYVDLGDLVTRLQIGTPHRIKAAASAVLRSLENSTVYQLKSARNSRAHGLSIYYPTSLAAIEASYGLQQDSSDWLRAIKQSLILDDSVTVVQSSSATENSSGWRASVTLSRPIDSGVSGYSVFGELQESGLHGFVFQPAVLRAGGPNSFQAVMSWHRFAFGGSWITAYLDFATGLLDFPAIHVSKRSRHQTRVWGRAEARYKSGVWQFSKPTFTTVQSGTVVPISLGDIVAPVVWVYRSMSSKNGTVSYTVVGEIAQMGRATDSTLRAVDLPAGTKSGVDMLLTEPGTDRMLLRESLSVTNS